MRQIPRPLTLMPLVLAAACSDILPPDTDPSFARSATVVDRAMAAADISQFTSGLINVTFLPPLGAQPSHAAGRFDASLSPQVLTCAEWYGEWGCDPIASFTTMDEIDRRNEFYMVNWHLRHFPIEQGQTYRIMVVVNDVVFGHHDLVVTNTQRTVPIRFRITTDDVFVHVYSNGSTWCGLTAEGKAYCWGNNWLGQAGVGTAGVEDEDGYTHVFRPTAVVGDHVFLTLAMSDFHTCGLTVDQEMYCWGYDGWAQIGRDPSHYPGEGGWEGENNAVAAPTRAAAPLLFVDMHLGAYHTCGLTPDGEAWCWGMNRQGQIGDGGEEPFSPEWLLPTQVVGGHVFVSLNGGELHTCGISESGARYCWGDSWGSTPVLVEG
jgi:hypothetical protein